ncbi:MAG TPA: hypothetical protein VIG82_03180, partial [Enteractinococcus sp.]
ALLEQVAARRGLLIEQLSREQLRVRVFDALLTPMVFIASIPVAYLTDGETAKLCWLALIALGPFGARFVRRVDARSKRPATQTEVPQ